MTVNMNAKTPHMQKGPIPLFTLSP